MIKCFDLLGELEIEFKVKNKSEIDASGGKNTLTTIRCGSVTFEHIAAVIFDKDGTLASSEEFLRSLAIKRSRLVDAQVPGVGEPLLMAWGIEGTRFNPAGLMAVGTRRENEIAAAAYIAETGRDWIEALAIAEKAFQEADLVFPDKAQQTPVFPGTVELLQRLAATEIKIGILSADSTDNVKEFVKRYQLEAYIELQMGVVRGLSKPDPRLFEQACEVLGVRPEHTLMIGDSQADFGMAKAARAAGCVGVSWGWTLPVRLDDADVAIAQFDEMQVIG